MTAAQQPPDPYELPPMPDYGYEDPANDAGYAPPPTGPVLTSMDSYDAKPVEWLWRKWIPFGMVSLADGDPGKGKSLFTLDLAARVSTGNPMPDGSDTLEGPGGVILVSAEDDPNCTIRPRLDAAHADCSRIHLLNGITKLDKDGNPYRAEYGIADIDELETAVYKTAASLVIIDPLMAYLGGDAHRDNEVRRSLRPLAEMAARTGVAVLIVRHLNKSGGGSPIYRGGGSIGIIGAARSAFLFAPDQDDETGKRIVIAPTKSNVSARPTSIAYEVVIEDDVPRIRWLGESDKDAESLLDTETSRGAARDEATQLLLAELGAGGTCLARDLYDQAQLVGISEKTLKRAKKSLGVISFHQDGDSAWYWRLPGKQ